MALSERHRWCIDKIREAFGDELNSEAVNTFMRQEAVLTKFTQFFAGESSGRLFVFYQPEVIEDGVRKNETMMVSWGWIKRDGRDVTALSSRIEIWHCASIDHVVY